jgi:hypothetical protein
LWGCRLVSTPIRPYVPFAARKSSKIFRFFLRT